MDANQEWDEYLRLVMFSYNTSVHERTQYTPYELVFGKTAETPSSNPPIKDDVIETYTNYLTHLFGRLTERLRFACENLIQSKERSKKYYNRKTNPQIFQIGDLVYLIKEPSGRKLDDQYTRQYEVIEKLSSCNVKLDLGNNRTKLVHQDKIRTAKAGVNPTLHDTKVKRQEHDRDGRVQFETQSDMYLAALTLVTAAIVTQVTGLLGYDCGGEGLNITSLSLTDISDCHAENLEPKKENTYL